MTDVVALDREYDVVVAGGGGAGLMAAVEAAEAGVRVLLVEKQPALGGATAMSIGSITAAGTKLQEKAGIRDSVDAHYQDVLKSLTSFHGEAGYDLDLTRLMCEVAPRVIERLSGVGVRFSGPHPEPPHSVYRMHNVVPDSRAYIEALSRAAVERGATIRTETTIQKLHLSDSGAVTALTLGHEGRKTGLVKVNRGVVLAAGDFSANDELARANGRPPEISRIEPMRPYATGDGIVVATAIGAATVAMHRTGGASFRTVVPPYCSPDRGLLVEGAILVNREGHRFTNELRAAAMATNDQPAKVAYLVFDARVAGRIAVAGDDAPRSRDGWYRRGKLQACTFPGTAYAYLDDLRRTEYFYEAASPEGLAQKIGVPKDALRREIERDSQMPAGAVDRFGRERSLNPGFEPPFYALGPIKAFNIFSGGGLAIDREMRVLDSDRRPIPGLYACGANGEAGVYLGGHGHHLAWAFGTGQIAGRNAEARKPA